MNKQFPPRKIEIVNKHLRKCSALVVIKEMQIKAILKCYLTRTKLAFFKFMGWQGAGDRGVHFRQHYKSVPALRKLRGK